MPGRRVKGGFARSAALDPPDRRGGREEGSRAEEDGEPKGKPRFSPTRLKGALP